MGRWQTKRIEELGRVVTGKTPSSDNPEEFGAEYPFITPSDIPATQKHVSAERFLSEKGMEAHKRILLPPKSVCVVCIGATIGKVCTTDRPSFCNQQINAVIPNSGDHSPEFVYYLCTTLKDALVSFAGGAATPIVNKSTFSSIKVLSPDHDEQKKIAAILSAYDDLIENNRRRIALLEKMAEEIYREWFVRMRFPGHEQAKFVKGVPEGWSLKRFSDAVQINPAERLRKDEYHPFVGMENLSLNSMYFRSKESRLGGSGSKFRNGDILFPRITPSLENGKRGFVMTLQPGEIGFGSTEFIVFREKELSPEHIYLLSCSPDFRKHAELSMSGASGRQRVSEDCFSFFLIAIPPMEIRDRFVAFVRPMFDEIKVLAEQMGQCVRMRDALLPRLISGKLNVETLDIHFPPSMEESAHEV